MRTLLLIGAVAAGALSGCQSVTGLSDLEFGDEPAAGAAGSGGSGESGSSGQSGASGVAGVAGAAGASGAAGQGGLGGAGGASGVGGGAGAGQGGSAGSGGVAGSGGAGGGGASGGSSGAAGVSCTASNQAPVAAVESMTIMGVAGQEILLDATASADPEGGPLTFAWAPVGPAPAPLDATLPKARVVVPECGDYVFTVKVTDGCGASSEAQVKLSAPSGGYVASAGCDPSKACGGKSLPWCDLQAAVDGTDGPVVLRAAAGDYGPVVLRGGVSIEGGYSQDFSTRSAILSLEGTVVVAGGGVAIQGPEQGDAAVDGVLVSWQLAAAQEELVGIAQRGAGALAVSNVQVSGGEAGQAVQRACGVQRSAEATGPLTIDASTIEAPGAVLLSAGVCLGGAGVVKVNDSVLRGGKAEASVGLDSTATGPLEVNGGVIGASDGGLHAAGLRWITPSASPGATATLSEVQVRGGRGPQVHGIEAQRIGALKVQGGEVRGEEAEGGPEGTMGVGVWASLVGESDGFGVTLEGTAVVGATTALERVGVYADGTSLRITESTVDGSLLPGGRRAVGVRVQGIDPIKNGVSLDKNVRLGGGAPSGGGMKYEAYGVEMLAPVKATIADNKQVIGCSAACKADAPGSIAAGVRLAHGEHEIKNNAAITGGGQLGGASAASSQHHGILAEVGCPGDGCVHFNAFANTQIAGNVAPDQAPGEATGVEATGVAFELSSNASVLGGHALEVATGVSASGSKGVQILSNTLGGGAAKTTVGLRTEAQLELRANGNFIDACGLVSGAAGADPACKETSQSVGVISHDDANSRLSNNYILGGFGETSTACELGNGDLAPELGAVEFVYNLCLAQGRVQPAQGPKTESTGVRVVGLSAKAARGIVLLNNIFMSGNQATERYAGVEGPVTTLLVRNNDFLLVSSIQGLGPGLALYRRGATEIDDLATLNKSSANGTFDGNLSKDPQFKGPVSKPENLANLTAAGLHLGDTCALRNAGIPSSELGDFDGELRGNGGEKGYPEVGPDECP